MFNIAVAQSGGPTSAINASLLGVFSEGLACNKVDEIYGVKNGIQGAINGNFLKLKDIIKTEDDEDMLKHTPAAFLGSCRFRLAHYSEDESVYKTIVANFLSNNIKAFFYIGGNDSMDTVSKLSEYMLKEQLDIKIVGIPKTIDNDLCGTDHTPGFGSAAKFLATSLNEIISDSLVYDLPSVTIVEIMGRDAGWLTACGCVLKRHKLEVPILFYLPEEPFSDDKFITDIKEAAKKHKSVIVCVSEGIKDIDNNYIGIRAETEVTDEFGHTCLSGVGRYLEHKVRKFINCKVRLIELSVLQRCSAHIASATDLDESQFIGEEAVKAAINGKTGVMMGFNRVSNYPYKIDIVCTDAKDCANFVKPFPREWIINGSDISDDAIDYFLPLIKGEVCIKYADGIPMHFKVREEI